MSIENAFQLHEIASLNAHLGKIVITFDGISITYRPHSWLFPFRLSARQFDAFFCSRRNVALAQKKNIKNNQLI